MSKEKPKIFISYAWDDQQLVQRLENALGNAGAKIWIDHSEVRGGDNLPKRISDALEWSNVLILVWSKASSKSQWVEREWTNAISLGKEIIPCILDKTKLPAILANKLFLDFTVFESGFPSLLHALELDMQSIPAQVTQETMNTQGSPNYQSTDSLTPNQTLEPSGAANETSRKQARNIPKHTQVSQRFNHSKWSNFWLLLIAFIITLILFHLMTGQSVLFTKWLFSETNLLPQESVDMVFDEKTGKFLVDLSPAIQLSAIRYEFLYGTTQGQFELQLYTQQSFDYLPVELGKEGWKIRLERLFDNELILEKGMPYVPQKIDLVVYHLQPSENPILIYVITDEIYPQQLSFHILPFRKTKVYPSIQIGQMGMLNYIDLSDFSVTPASSPNIVSPGIGPVAAIVAVEFERGKPILRSNIIFVLRRGILHPWDVLFDQNLQPFISQPISNDGHRMVAFQSPEPIMTTNDIVISNIEGSTFANIDRTLFSGTEEVICGWGNDEQNLSTLYFLSSREGGNTKVPYKVVVANDGGLEQPIRLSSLPMLCGE